MTHLFFIVGVGKTMQPALPKNSKEDCIFKNEITLLLPEYNREILK